MIYIGNLKVKNTCDIIENLQKKNEIIKSLAYHIIMKQNYFSDDFDINKECENLLYNVVDDLKGHQNIIDLENQIITISNNTVNKYNYPKKYLIDYVYM